MMQFTDLLHAFVFDMRSRRPDETRSRQNQVRGRVPSVAGISNTSKCDVGANLQMWLAMCSISTAR